MQLNKFLSLFSPMHPFKKFFENFYFEPKIWKKFYFNSILDNLVPSKVYPQFPNGFSELMSPLQSLLFMKFFRSENIDRYIRDFLNESFKNAFYNKTDSTLEQLIMLNWFNRPTIVFYSKLNLCYNDLLELKAFRYNLKKAIARISLCDFTYEVCENEIDLAFKEQKWVVLQNLNCLTHKNQMKLFKKLNEICSTWTENSRIRIWIFFQLDSEFNKNCKDSTLISFISSCCHIYLHNSFSLKTVLGAIFIFDKEEYKGQLSQKAQQIHMKTINKNTFASRTIKTQFHDQLFLRFTKLRKRIHSFNLHSFIDLQELREKNSIYVSMIEAGSKKIRFTLSFLLAILKERRIYERVLFSKFYVDENEFFVSGNDIVILLEDGFQFLELFTINPLPFLEKLLRTVFNDWSIYNNNFHEDIIKNMLRDYATSSQEKQLVITVGNFKYELFKFLPDSTFEEAITKTIHDFPSEDPVDILGFNVNSEYQLNYLQSVETMNCLRTFYKSYVQLEEKCEIEDKIIASLDNEKQDLQENILVKYENVLFCLKELNLTNPLEQRIQLIENILNLIKEDISFSWCSANSQEPYLDEETIMEWFQDKNLDENLQNSSPIDEIEVITFKKLHLSLKRNTSIRSSIKKLSKVFALYLTPSLNFEDNNDNVKSAVLGNKSKFSISKAQRIGNSSATLKPMQQNEVNI